MDGFGTVGTFLSQTISGSLYSASAYTAMQDDIYKPDYYLSLLDFRELTLQRLKHFVNQKFFSVSDYLQGEPLAVVYQVTD